MNELKFSNGDVDLKIKEINGEIYFDVEQSAVGLGIFLEKTVISMLGGSELESI